MHVVYVALVVVALAAAETLNVIWRVGARFERELTDFKVVLPYPTELALEGRTAISIVVLIALAAAVLLHRHPRAVLLLVLIGCLELTIGGAYAAALWLPFVPWGGGPVR